MGTVSTMEKVLSKRPKHISSVSAAIKLDYDTSDPVYITVRHLILKFVLKWIMPGIYVSMYNSLHSCVCYYQSHL